MSTPIEIPSSSVRSLVGEFTTTDADPSADGVKFALTTVGANEPAAGDAAWQDGTIDRVRQESLDTNRPRWRARYTTCTLGSSSAAIEVTDDTWYWLWVRYTDGTAIVIDRIATLHAT